MIDGQGFAGYPIVLPRACIFDGLDEEIVAALADDTEWFSLPGGQVLFEDGDPSDALYLLVTGALAVIAGRPYQQGELLGLIRPGETVGEMGVLSQRPRTATIVAIRDSSLLRISRAAFARLLQHDPGTSLRLVGQLVDWLDQTTRGRRAQFVPRTLAILSLTPVGVAEAVARRLAVTISATGLAVAVLDATAIHEPTEHFHEIERDHDLTIYAAVAGATGGEEVWTSLSIRRADQLLLVADAHAPAPERIPAIDRQERLPWRRTDLVLLHLNAGSRPMTARWLGRHDVRNHYHIRWSVEDDMARLARYVTGQAVALVLSGGGARGFGHVGVIRALREGGIPIDMIGGTSIGAIIAAGVALEWDDAEFDHRMRSAFVNSNPLNDYTIPFVSLTRGRKVAARLQQNFGDRRIEDLWIPFYCVASNLTTGRETVLRQGALWQALRTTIAIPGLLPPSIADGEVLADGALLNNLPTDVMAAIARGPVVGVDVTRYRSLSAHGRPRRWRPHRLLHPGYKGPGIASLLMRAATISSDAQTRTSRDHVDILLEPPLAAVDMRDWGAYDRAVEAGYRYALEHLPAVVKAVRSPPLCTPDLRGRNSRM